MNQSGDFSHEKGGGEDGFLTHHLTMAPGGATKKRKPIKILFRAKCEHAQETGCQRTFRGQSCCKAVAQTRECAPPKNILKAFADGIGITEAQIRIANGCHL